MYVPYDMGLTHVLQLFINAVMLLWQQYFGWLW